MKRYRIINFYVIVITFMIGLTFISCRDGNNSQGADAANEANGDTNGSPSPTDNENSGSSSGTGSGSGGQTSGQGD